MVESAPARTPRKRHWIHIYVPQIKFWSIWLGFLGMMFLFRSFLTLIFLTFIMTYSINTLITKITARVTWPRWTMVVLVYFCVAAVLVGMGMTVFPKVYQEGKALSTEIPEAKDKLLKSIRSLLADPEFSRFIENMGLEESLKQHASDLVQWSTELLKVLFRFSFHLLLSLIFSFLIIWDLQSLRHNVRSLSDTRLKIFMDVLGPKIIQFSDVVGKAFEAQIVVAMVNTLMTLVGMTILGVPSMLFMSVIVCICSFIPVVGVFLSSVPICLMAYKTGAFPLAFSCALLIVFIHLVEAYILNPQIVGSHFSVHPFVAVCILVGGEYWFGVWGLLLGVPVAVFLFRSFILPEVPVGVPLEPVPDGKKSSEGA